MPFHRYVWVSAVFLAIAALIFGAALAFGFLGGYFYAYPIIPLYFYAMGLLGVYAMRRLMAGEKRRFAARFLLITVGKLIINILFVLCCLWLLPPEHRLALVLTALLCYLLTLLLSVRYIK